MGGFLRYAGISEPGGGNRFCRADTTNGRSRLVKGVFHGPSDDFGKIRI
jgi:hypothetical protein